MYTAVAARDSQGARPHGASVDAERARTGTTAGRLLHGAHALAARVDGGGGAHSLVLRAITT